MTKRLAIVGASARAAASSASRAGFEVVAADLFADADLLRRCPATRIEAYPDGLADWLVAQEVDAWMYSGALENYPRLVDRMAAIRPLWGNHGEALRRSRDPFELQRVCDSHAIAFPETTRTAPPTGDAGAWIVKSPRSSNGAGVSSANEGQSGLSDEVVFQRIVAGTPAAAVYVVEERQSRLVGVTEQLVGLPWLNAKRWAYCGSIADHRSITANYEAQYRKIGDALRLNFELRGLVGVDVIVDRERVWLIEINPRYTASVEIAESLRGAHAVALHAACFGSHEGSGLQPHPARLGGKAILYAPYDLTVSAAFSDWAMGQAHDGLLADVPRQGGSIATGHPILTLHETDGGVDTLSRLKLRAETTYENLLTDQ